MDVDTILSAWWFILFSVMVWLTIALPRRALEYFIPKLKAAHWWTDLALPTAAPILGLGYALVLHDFPMLSEQSSVSVRCALGALAGYLSSHVVRTIKARLKAKTGIDVDSVPPGPPMNSGEDGSTLQ